MVVYLGLNSINSRETMRDFEESNDSGALKEEDAGSLGQRERSQKANFVGGYCNTFDK